MLLLLIDENLNHRILRGLVRSVPRLDYLLASDAGLKGTNDPAVLDFAARENRVLATHDLRTTLGQHFGHCLIDFRGITASLPAQRRGKCHTPKSHFLDRGEESWQPRSSSQVVGLCGSLLTSFCPAPHCIVRAINLVRVELISGSLRHVAWLSFTSAMLPAKAPP